MLLYTDWAVWKLRHASIPFMLFPYHRRAAWNSSSVIHGIIGTKSEFFHIRIFFIWIWSFLYQALADGIGPERTSWSGDHAGTKQCARLSSRYRSPQCAPLCRHYGILGGWAPSKKLVVRPQQVSILKLVLILATYFWTWYITGTFHPYFSLLIFSQHNHGSSLPHSWK